MKDERLFELAVEHEELKAMRDKVEAKRKKIADRICQELDGRGLKTIEGNEDNPYRITITIRPREHFDVDQAKKVLGKRFSKVCKPVIDKDAVTYLLQQEQITPDELRKFSKISFDNPFPRITELEV